MGSGVRLAIGAAMFLAGAGAFSRRGGRGALNEGGQEDAWDALWDLGTIHVSEHAPVALVRDLVELEPKLRRELKRTGWPLDSCTGSTSILGPWLAERGWRGSQVTDGVYMPTWSRDPADGTGHDWIVIEHDGRRIIVDAAVSQFDEEDEDGREGVGWPDSDRWYVGGWAGPLEGGA